MGEATFTFQVDETLKDEFSLVARARDRNGAQLLRDFMRAYVEEQRDGTEHDAWFRHHVQVGTAEVEARFAARRAATQRRLDALK